MTTEQTAINDVLNFFEMSEPYTDKEEYEDEWENLIYDNPVQAYEYFDEYKRDAIDCCDSETYELFEKALNSLYECVLCNEEV